MRRTPILALVLTALSATAAGAQTIAISGGPGPGLYTQQVDVPLASQFDVAIWIDPAGLGSKGIEFGYTNLPTIRPGVIQTNLWTIVPILILPPCSDGDCVFGFGECIAAANPLELVRITYIDLNGATGADVVLTVGPAQLSSFDGSPGFVDCDDNLVPLEPGGTPGGVTGSGAVFPSGSVVLNPTPVVVSNEAPSFGGLKARY